MERPITRRMKKGAVRRPNFRADPFKFRADPLSTKRHRLARSSEAPRRPAQIDIYLFC